jgi:methyl-accepting chemotaxis protein
MMPKRKEHYIMQLKQKKGMRLTIGVQILTTCIAIAVIFTGLNIYTYFQMQDIESGYMGLVTRSAPLVFDIKDIEAKLNAQSSLVRGYILTGDAKYVESYDISRQEMRKKIADVEKKLTTPEGKQKVGELKLTLEEYHKVADQAIVARKNKGQMEALSVVATAGTKIEAAEKSTVSVVNFLMERMDLRVSQNQAASKRVYLVVLTLSGIILLLAIGISIDLARRISRPLASVVAAAEQIASGNLTYKTIDYHGNDEIKELLVSFTAMAEHLRRLITQVARSAEQLAAASEQLTASAEQSAQASGQVAETVTEVAAGASDQVSSVNQAVAVVKVMASAIEHIAKNASDVSGKSKDTTRAATAGITTMTEASQQMLLINHSVSQSAQVVQKLGESSKQIGEIVDAISGIAGQTNLLALNAAIEAARAGEQGRGFAVVADEVRKLAEQSQEAAQTIANIVKDIQSETANVVVVMDKGSAEASKGTEIMDATGARFKEIAGLVNDLNGQIQAISSAAEELSASSEDVVNAVEGVKNVATETAANTQTISASAEEQSASMEEVASSSQALARMAEELQGVVRTFRL